MFGEIIGNISGFMYGKLLIFMLIAVGIYFTIRTRFVQFRFFKESIKVVTEKPMDVDNLLIYLNHKKEPSKKFMTCFRIFAAFIIFIGALMSMGTVWDLADVLMGIMTIINLPVICIAGGTALKALDDYTNQTKQCSAFLCIHAAPPASAFPKRHICCDLPSLYSKIRQC